MIDLNRGCKNGDGTEKRGHTRKVAKKKAAQMVGPSWRSKGLQVYRCGSCGWYHIGHNAYVGKERRHYG